MAKKTCHIWVDYIEGCFFFVFMDESVKVSRMDGSLDFEPTARFLLEVS
jgi:hypothetical protein